MTGVSQTDNPEVATMFDHVAPPSHVALHTRIRQALPKVEDFVVDRILDLRLAAIRRSAAYKAVPRRRILAVGVQSPRRPNALDAIFAQMGRTRHDIVFDQKEIEGKGKLENTNILLERHDLADFDWVFTVDDDVALPPLFTDTFIALAEAAELKIAGPAHRAKSFFSYGVTRRRPRALVRQTSFVEVGPIVAFRRETFADVFPLPALRYGWGLDLTWPMLVRRKGWRMGIIDAAALEHLNPVAATYDAQTAIDEAKGYMEEKGFLPREECWLTLRTWKTFPV